MTDAQKKMLEEIMTLGFCVLEQNLYLDGHPDNTEALSDFRKNSDKLKRLTEAYEEEYAPLTAAGDGYENSFQWVKQPFPWEMEDD